MNKLTSSQKEIINKLLKIEHNNYASMLELVNKKPQTIDRKLLIHTISLIDKLSRYEQEFPRRVSILAIALCWEYSDPDYKESLREIFIVVLTRMGIAPSTMLIDECYKLDGHYKPFSSYLNELSVLVNQLKYEVSINSRTFLLTQFQKQVWDSIDHNKIICISAPTSAGKSFVIYLKIIKKLLEGNTRIVYIVPTISLVNQVTKDLIKLLKEFSIVDVDVFTGIQKDISSRFIYVLTQERAISGFGENSHFTELNLLVVDEVQNIERVANDSDQRSKILYDFLKEIKNQTVTDSIILSGPRLKNIGNLGFDIFDEISYEAKTKLPPVVNITYSISASGKRYYFNQYSDIYENPTTIEISNPSEIKGIGGTQYNNNFHNYLLSILNKIDSKKSNLIFSPTARQARKTAIFLSENKPNIDSDQIESLSEYIEYFVHPQYDLAQIVKCGVAYHTGKLPLHIRSAIEDAFSSNIINNIVCTTTLMQGVNFPASNIIIRNPYLFVKRRSLAENVKLSNYEFSNLRGRAGRLLKEFIGRTIVLDESSFEVEPTQDSLFEHVEKEINTGYGDYYQKYKNDIEEKISNDIIADDGKEKHLLTYIRQTIFRHREASITRLSEVGIDIDENQVRHTIQSLDQLEVPSSVIWNNRYWDPFDLELIFQYKKNRAIEPIPNNIWDKGLQNSLIRAMTSFMENFPYYFRKYIGNTNEDMERMSILIWSICTYATDWGREKLLREILAERDFSDNASDGIDNAVQTITSKVCFGLPMLLKPLADMSPIENSVLGIIETGAFNKITNFLISKGVPRDTAIFLKNTYLQEFDIDEPNLHEVQLHLGKIKSNLSPWIESQIDSVCI
ncbi:DEAD/DEAH box helicase [Providencia manganoxydans]|uniref:DEAD/DEAH box helicase n=1 Tax=Providencia manganoxydans TaxID=2923283 RepID=UPI0034E4B6C6